MKKDRTLKTALFHQAHFLPWPGYIARCLDTNMVIFLNDVKFNKGYYHNRCKIINCHGVPTWLTIPINRRTMNGSLKLVRIADKPLFKKWFRAFRLAYQDKEDFNEIWECLQFYFFKCYPELDRFNQQMLIWVICKICKILGQKKPQFKESSTYTSSTTEKTQRLLYLCKIFKIREILMGADSYRVHDVDKLTKFGIKSVRHVHCSDILNREKGNVSLPISGVTFLHYALTDGWEKASRQLTNDWVAVRQ